MPKRLPIAKHAFRAAAELTATADCDHCKLTTRPTKAAREPAQPKGPEGPGGGEEGKTGTVTKPRPKTQRPNLYKVLLLNDDYTPMEFVVHVLERFFNKSRPEAERIMWHVHRRGIGVCGVFTFEVAETKVTHVMEFARQHQHPLQCRMEKD